MSDLTLDFEGSMCPLDDQYSATSPLGGRKHSPHTFRFAYSSGAAVDSFLLIESLSLDPWLHSPPRVPGYSCRVTAPCNQGMPTTSAGFNCVRPTRCCFGNIALR